LTTYRTTRTTPQAAFAVRVRKMHGGGWLACPLLASAGGWARVDDGAGPLWVLLDHIHRLDWPTLNLLTRLQEARN
jgi:hypothetical protein